MVEFCASFLREYSQVRRAILRKGSSYREIHILSKRVTFSTASVVAGLQLARIYWGIPKRDRSVARQPELPGEN
jgi:hypothetical protein